MTHNKHVPVRMCMGCGARALQPELLRVARARDGSLAIAGRTQHGRTGYLHRRQECWERFAARKGPVRSLRYSIDKTTRIALVEELKRAARHHGADCHVA